MWARDTGAKRVLRTRFVGDKVLFLLAISRFPQEARPSAVPRHRLAVAGRGGRRGPDTARLCAADRVQAHRDEPACDRGTRGDGAGRRGHTRARARRLVIGYAQPGRRPPWARTLLAGEHVIVLTEGGDVVLVFATLARHEELARVPVLDGRTWNHPVVAEGHLLVRNLREMAAFDP